MSPTWFPGMVDAADMPDPESGPPRRRARWAVPMLVVAGAVLVATVLLRFQGRLWICSCGEVYLWAGDIWSSNNSQHIADPYTLTHVLHGVVAFWILLPLARRVGPSWRFASAVSAEALWEVVENSRYVIERYRAATIAVGYVGDTIVNSLGDILVCGAGFALAGYLGVRRSVYVFVAVELVLLFWIRDGLILNVIMLIYPVEAILDWQGG